MIRAEGDAICDRYVLDLARQASLIETPESRRIDFVLRVRRLESPNPEATPSVATSVVKPEVIRVIGSVINSLDITRLQLEHVQTVLQRHDRPIARCR